MTTKLHPFTARCKYCGALTILAKATVHFFCINCGKKNKSGLGRYGNPLVPKVNCQECGYNFGIEPADYCTNELHKLAWEKKEAEIAAAEARRNQPRVEPAAGWEGVSITIKRENGKWKFA